MLRHIGGGGGGRDGKRGYVGVGITPYEASNFGKAKKDTIFEMVLHTS